MVAGAYGDGRGRLPGAGWTSVSDESYFICYSRADGAEFARRLADDLEGGTPAFDVWIDREKIRPAQLWDNEVVEAIRRCRAMLFVMTPGGVRPDSFCLKELHKAVSYQKPVVPLRLDADVEAPLLLAAVQYVHFDRGYQAGLTELRDYLGSMDAGGGSPPPDPPRERALPERVIPETGDLERCLQALGVPEHDLRPALEWLVRSATDDRYRAVPPAGSWSDGLRQAVIAFQRDIELFAQPALLLASSSYLSISKLRRMYAARQQELGHEDNADNRFKLLHRDLAQRHRLDFGPALLLLGRELPAGDDAWLYFSGRFTIANNSEILDTIPDAQRIIGTRDERSLMTLVNRVFKWTDPAFLPFLEFDGSLGPHQVRMAISRKYVRTESSNSWVLGSALLGDPITFAGFGMLTGNDLQPVIGLVAE